MGLHKRVVFGATVVGDACCGGFRKMEAQKFSMEEIVRAADHEGCPFLEVMCKVLGVSYNPVGCFLASGRPESPIAPATVMRLLLADDECVWELNARISRSEEAMRMLMRSECFLLLPVDDVLIMVLGAIRRCGTWPMRVFVAAGVAVAPDDLNEYMVPGCRDYDDDDAPASLREVLNISEALAMLRTIVPLPTELGNRLADGDPEAVCGWNAYVPQGVEFANYLESMRAAAIRPPVRPRIDCGKFAPLDANVNARRPARGLRRVRDFDPDDGGERARGAERESALE